MKTLSLLFSLLLGAAVLFIFVPPWGALEKLLGVTATRASAPASARICPSRAAVASVGRPSSAPAAPFSTSATRIGPQRAVPVVPPSQVQAVLGMLPPGIGQLPTIVTQR